LTERPNIAIKDTQTKTKKIIFEPQPQKTDMQSASLLKISLLASTILLLFSQCRQSAPSGPDQGIKQGTIIYNITYPRNLDLGPLAFLMPGELKVQFNEGKQRLSFKSNLSLYNLDFIHTNQTDSFYTLLRVLDKKLFVPSESNSHLFLFNQEATQNIQFHKDTTRTIAGYPCSKATYTPTNPRHPVVNIWYTSEIGIQHTNRNTPFELIPGLMLEFEITYNNITFHLQATQIMEEEHPGSLFQIPSDYKATDLAEIEQLIQSVLAT
jgi:GLPGLI family protein